MSMVGDLLRLLMQSEQSSNNPNALPQALGGMLGNNQGGAGADQLLGALEQMMAGGGQGAAQNMNPAANGVPLNMVQSVAEQLSRRTGLPPQSAQMVVSLVLHRMLTSHAAFGNNARLNLQDVLQQMMTTGGVSPDVLHNSGMVNDLANAGMDRQAALQHLTEAFSLLSGHIQNSSGQ
ncbi:MAG TPA: hypothetical protein VLZ89_00100 [Anaerolineales bacterium]|nr:hypothetical protein [Anaerolineales bacterium]